MSAATASRNGAGGVELRLPYRPPLDWSSLIGFLGRRALPGVEVVGSDFYRRTVSIGETAGWIEVGYVPAATYLVLRVHVPAPQSLLPIVERVRRVFDLGADPMQVRAVLERDPALAPVLAAVPGLRLPGAWDPFELAIRAILGQQVSVRGAVTLTGRLVAAFGEELRPAGPDGLTHLFPTPERLANADLTGIGLPGARAAAIRETAARVADGSLSFSTAGELDATMERLVALPGIGPWTAAYIAMRALGEPDAFPASDLVLRKALSNGGPILSARALLKRAEAWRPWRAYAAIALWLRGGIVEASAEEQA